jgi:hypothetical protein
MGRNLIDSELKVIYIYRGVKFFTRKEAQEFKDLSETIDQNNENEKEMIRNWKQQSKEKNLTLMQKALESD